MPDPPSPPGGTPPAPVAPTQEQIDIMKQLVVASNNKIEADKKIIAIQEAATKSGIDLNKVQAQGIKLFNQGTEAIESHITQSKALGKVYQSLKEQSLELTRTDIAFTEGQIMGLSQISNAVSNTTKLYANLGQVNFAMGFSEQYSVIAQLAEDTFKSVKKLTPQAIEDAFAKAKLKIPLDTLMKGKDAVNDYIKAQLNAADAGLRLRDSILTNASATGTLGTVYQKSGSELTSLNALLHKHRTMIDLAAQATNTAPEAVQKYYSELGKLPGTLDQVINLTDKGGIKTSMLSATLLLARGAGMDASEAIVSMREALDDYDASGEKAITYVARMSEMSTKLGLELGHVRNFMHSTSEVLGKFGNNTDAAARILNNYSAALRSSGASGKQTVDMIDTMTKGIAGLTTAQKALLSARSGGPGGLVGALKIDKIIKEGKTDEIMEMARKDLTKQFGKVITLEDALKDTRLAPQFKKQQAMLQSGPYGNLVGDEQKATRWLEAFKKIESGARPEDIYKPEGSQSVGAKIMEKGQQIGDQSATAFGMSGLQFRASQNTGAVVGMETVQGTFAARSGSHTIGTEINNDAAVEMRQNILREQNNARYQGAKRTGELGRENTHAGLYQDASRLHAKEDFASKVEFLQNNAVKMMEAPLNLVKSMLDTKPTAMQNQSRLNNLIRGERSAPTDPEVMVPVPQTKEKDNAKAKTIKKQGQQQEQQASQESRQKVDVHITGFCLSCKTKMDNASMNVNPTAGR
jgi:hypothetical protein